VAQLVAGQLGLGYGARQGRDQPHVLDRRRRRAGQGLERVDLLGRGVVDLAPIGADGPDRIGRTHRRHGHTAHEGLAVQIVGHPFIARDIGDDSRLAIEHGPAADARGDGEAATLPQRAERVFLDVVTDIAFAQDDGDAVRADQATGRGADGFDDILDGGRAGQALDGVDQTPRRSAAKAQPISILTWLGHGPSLAQPVPPLFTKR
jgi:hypothetical protein